MLLNTLLAGFHVVNVGIFEYLQHFLFYIGSKKFLNKHGTLDIYIQDLESSMKNYPCDSLRIHRVRPEFYNEDIEWKEKY